MQEDDFCAGEQFATRFTLESIHCISILSKMHLTAMESRNRCFKYKTDSESGRSTKFVSWKPTVALWVPVMQKDYFHEKLHLR